MTGAIGYGELSWINSLFTLAGRLLSEAGDVGASGDPALCYGERGACKCGPKSLVGMSPGTIPWFSTTAASIIIRGRPLLDAIVKPRRGGTSSSTLDLFQSNNGTLGHIVRINVPRVYMLMHDKHRQRRSKVLMSKLLLTWCFILEVNLKLNFPIQINYSNICITFISILLIPWKNWAVILMQTGQLGITCCVQVTVVTALPTSH